MLMANQAELLTFFLPSSVTYIRYKYLDTPHVQREQGKVIRVGVHIYMFVDQFFLNHTLAIDSPFQTFAVGLLVEFID